MPASIWTANTVKVALRYKVNVEACYTVFHVKCAGVPTLADLNAIHGVVNNWENNTNKTKRSTASWWLGAKYLSVHSAGAPFLDYVVTLPATGIVGTIAATTKAWQSIVVRLSTGLSGRSFLGRVFTIGVQESAYAQDGSVSAAVAGTHQVSWETLRTALVSAGYQLAVVSLYSGKDGNGNSLPRAAGIATPVTSISYSGRVGIMKKRMVQV